MAWGAQLATVISGLILPKLFLTYFGSETNGLIQSVSQFINYVNLLEGGLASVFLASIYKPLAEKDDETLSRRVYAAQKYYRIIAYFFVGYAIILSLVYPLIVKSSLDYSYASSLILILSFGMFAQYFFSITYKVLLQGDRKIYVVLSAQITTTILNVLIISISLKYINSVHIAKLISSLIYLIQPIVFNTYVNKKYNLKKIKNINPKEELPGRWACLGQNIAFFIHNNTDITLLTLISGLKIVSVYSVHTMVVIGLRNLVMAFSQVFSPKIGLSIAKGNPDEIENQIDQYEFISYFISTIFFGPCICLIVPFVLIYTANIVDVNYYEPLFAIILIYSEYIYCIRNPYIAVAYGAGKFKETTVSAYIEAGVNIIVSLILIWKLGLVGIAIGTSLAMTYRWIYLLFYLKNNIVHRSMNKAIKRFIISIACIFIGTILYKNIIWFEIKTFTHWALGGVLCFMIFLVVVAAMNYCFDRKTFLDLLLKRKVRPLKTQTNK